MNIASTLKSYTQSDCSAGNWSRFTQTFVSSYTGIRTLVFSFIHIKYAIIYLANINVFNTSNTQILTNGDFRLLNGTKPQGWIECFISANTYLATTCAAGGNGACYTVTQGNGTLSHTFPAISGMNYTIQFDMYHYSQLSNQDEITVNIGIV